MMEQRRNLERERESVIQQTFAVIDADDYGRIYAAACA